MTGRVTVHVLDTAQGRPAAGLRLSLERLSVPAEILGAWTTNLDGRCDAPLLEGDALLAGTYQIVFDVAGWRVGENQPDRGFYDLVPIRFIVSDPSAHHHVPLLLSPYGYSTYRGS
jgi:5-hydroxyisourate hydrolase